ncbi:uncharacterized protein LOC130207662 [Pseudoliparis swirei]|uniref:uncharacterized protein LOC130207662 n=1 Tax=Pseudoliparis swirei TaxID=2059687 RepID=UPI0024BD8706|nr:uncharacterized protein LOC130207662 [Pseudoliparis swirei]
MTSVEKRRSGRRSGGLEKHSDGGYSDTSSGGSYLDETDREVSNLTDRAFRSLCIGDEAVYNDSDLCSSSPCTQRDRQLAFSQSGQDRDREDKEREELESAAHGSFDLRMQQYGQDWIHGRMCEAEIQRDPQWEVYGERTQGRVSATFPHSFVETSQLQESLEEEQFSFLGNGTTELSTQQRRSRSRVSSLIRAFNSEGHWDGAGMDGKLREWNDETNWDKSALMSIQRELSEFSTPYQQNFNSGHFPSAGPFSSPDTNFYSSDIAGVAHMNSASSFMRSSHSKHSMSEQFNCNSNFFVHSEFSPFKVWRDHNRFPFQQAEFSGFMHCSEFPKWYETPMYRELSLDAQPQGPYRFDERVVKHPRNTVAPVVPPTIPRATSTSTILQKASAVEKRCESEFAGHYPNRSRMQCLGTKGFPLSRPSTASPTSEMSRRVQDTISSVKALQQKIKMMTEQNIATGTTANQQGVLCSNTNLNPLCNNAKIVASNAVSSNTSATPFNISQLLTPLVHAQQEEETSEDRHSAISPQPMEHPPVRAESRGATPDVRMSSYKSRATSLLFNLKDNRKRVKSTYSPTKFKELETLEKNKRYPTQEPRDTVIDIPDFPDPDSQLLRVEESSRTNAASHQYINLYNSPGLFTTPNSQPAHTGLYSEYTPSDYQGDQRPSEIVHQSGFTGFIPENYVSYQPANGKNLHEDSYTPYKQGMLNNVDTLGGDPSRCNLSYTATEIPRLNADNNQQREYFLSEANKAEQHFNETVGRDFKQVDRYQKHKENKHDYSNVSSQDSWRQTNSEGTVNLSLKAISPWKQEIPASMEKDQHAQDQQRADAVKEEANPPSNKYRGKNLQRINKEFEKIEFRESFGVSKNYHKKAEFINTNISNQLPQNAPFSNDTIEKPAYCGQQQPGTLNNKYIPQKYNGNMKEDEMKHNYLTQRYNKYPEQEYRNQHTLYSNKDKSMVSQENGQRNQYTPIPKVYEMQDLQPIEANPQLEHNMLKKSLSNPENASAPTMANQIKDRQFVEVRTEQAMAEQIKAQHAQAALAKAQHWAQVEQPKVETSRLILAGQTGSEKVKGDPVQAELTEHETVNQGEAEDIEEEKRKKERTEQPTEKQPEEFKEPDQTRVQKVPKEPRNIKEEVGAEHLRGDRGEQVEVNKAEAERLKEEHIRTEPAKTEQAAQTRFKKVKLEETQEQPAKEQEKTKVVEAEKVKANNILVEDVKQEKAEEEVQVSRSNAHQPKTQISKAKERKAEQAKLEQTKAELTKTKNMQEKSAEYAAKLIVTQQIKSEPDKVEKVKTELAKAKAELAKIKEKMSGEQKEKVRNIVHGKEDGIKTDLLLKLDINTNEENKDQDQATQMHQQREDIVVISGQYLDQANRGFNEYEHIREKYGFIDATSANRNKVSAAGNVSSNNANETPAESVDTVKTTNNEKSKESSSPARNVEKANTENKEEGGSYKPPELTESQYVYSELSKEFKLSDENHLPKNVDRRADRDIVRDTLKDDSVEKFEKCDPLKHTDISQHRDSDSAKLPLPEGNLKSTEHSAGLGRYHGTSPRALSSKEKAQAKQEILTSKIKAHAEKEISAIKEKGLAVPDGFISKHSTKQLAGSQSNHITQRPQSEEGPEKHESTMHSNMTLEHQIEPSGIQIETVKYALHPSSAPIPVRSAATTRHLDQLLKQVPKEPMKSNDNVPTTLREEKMGSYTMSTDEGLIENGKKENPSEIKSTIKSKEEVLKNKEGKLEANPGEISGKQKEGVKDTPPVKTDHFNKKKEDPSQATALVEAASSECMATEKADSKHEAVHEDSAPSLNLFLGQNKTPVDDDILQITGIMVTVRERKRSMDNGQRKNSTQEQMNVKECNNSEQEKCHPSSGLEVSKGHTYSEEVSTVQNTPVKEDQTRVDMNNHLENVQENPTLESRQNNVSENITVKRTDHQLESSSINTRPQLHEPFAEKHVPPSVAVLTQNKDFAETQPLLFKQDIIASKTKDCSNETLKEISENSRREDKIKSKTEEKHLQKRQTAHTNENCMAKVVNTEVSYTNPNRVDVESQIKHEVQPSVKEDPTTVINPSKSKNMDGKNAAQAERKGCDSTIPKSFNKTSPPNHLTDNEVFPQHQDKETHIGGDDRMDDSVHIGSIAIRVVPAVTHNNHLKMVGQHHVALVPCDVAAADEQKQVASSGLEGKVNSLNNEDRTKDAISGSSENKIKHDLEDTLGVQSVLSNVKKLSDSQQMCNQQNNIKANSEITPAENAKSEDINKNRRSVDESNIRPMVGDYFQVQGVAETNNESHNHKNVGDMSELVSTGKELPGLTPNKAAFSNELCCEGNNQDFMLDQSTRKTVESSSLRKNRETDGNLASKPSYGPSERQSNTNEKTEAGQANHIRKHHIENQYSLSARERQSTRNSNAIKDNMGKEKPEVKPIPKERVSTIPDISAIADYARLKVNVSEDEANTIQEFPPNKKEGFFPLIQSRHSRRPVFTADPQDVSVKDKPLPNKTKVSPKVNKEPKPLVFPITEKEHQRTGMFKLADKDRQEKMPLDAKANEGVVDTGAKHAQHLKERNTSPTTPLKNQGSEEQESGTEAHRVHQVEQSAHQPNKPPSQAATSSSAVNRPRSTSVSQHLKPLDDAAPLVGQVYEMEGCSATLRKDERTEKAPVKVERTERTRQERLATQHEETKAQQQRIAKQLEERRASRIEEEKRAEVIRVKHLMEENRASLAKEERRAAQREEERRARERETIAMKIKERREKQREAERKAAEKQTAQKEEEMRAQQREEERKMKKNEEKRRIKFEEGRRGTLREEEERIQELEARRRVKQQEAEKAAQEEQQRVAQEEQQRVAQEERQRVAQEERQRVAQEERQRVAQEERQRVAQEERQRVAQEEQQRVAQEEQHRRVAQEEQQRVAQEEQQRVAQEERQRVAEEEQQRVAQEEQHRRVAQEEQQRVAQEEQHRRANQEKEQMRAAQEEQQMRAALIEEQRRAKQLEEKILHDIEEEKKRKQREEGKEEKAAHFSVKERIKQEQKIEEQRGERNNNVKGMRTQREKDEGRAVEQEKTIIKQREEIQTKDERNRHTEESQLAHKEEEKRVTQELMLNQREDAIWAKKRKEEKENEEKLANHIEKERDTRVGEQKKAAEITDALQYYAITSTDTQRKPRERPPCSPLPSQQRHNPSGLGSSEDSGSHTTPHRPHAPASPAPSLPRSNTSSPALGGKPSMFRVKDNTVRGFPFKSVKPRFHKNFGEDFRVGSPMERGSEREQDEQEIVRRSAGTQLYPDTGLNRLAAIKESSTFQPAYLSQDYSALLSQYKPYSRRSFALEEDDSRSVFSNMSEGGESFATSAADMADIRGLYDNERPESACSFSSDVSRSLGKPPTVPPKSDKALRRAQRLTTRRVKKESSKIRTNSHAGVEKSLKISSSIPSSSSSSIELRSSSRQTVASPHFSSPVSLAHAPTLGSSFPSSQTEHQSSHSSYYTSPQATGPFSLPVASPHGTDPVSLPDASPKAAGPASQTAAPQTVAHVPSSPTVLHANHPAPVTQYHVESSYPHSYPLTQRKVLQDLGSGQYFVVDVPVQVKTKTFFDPETGKYVQLNVRQSGQSTALLQPQQTYSKTQLQPQMQVKLQQQPQASPGGTPFVLYQGNHSYPQDYQAQTFTSVPGHRSSAPLPLHQEQPSYGYPAHEMEQKSEGHRYSPEKTPYMDTVNDKDKTYSTVYNTHGPNEWFPESDTNSQLAGSTVCENDNSALSQC